MKFFNIGTVFALIALAFGLLVSGCSAIDDAQSGSATSLQQVQKNELFALKIAVESDAQSFSVGSHLQGGDYSLAMKCTGPDISSKIRWKTADGHYGGNAEVECAPHGSFQFDNIRFDKYADSLIFETDNISHRTITVSLAPRIPQG